MSEVYILSDEGKCNGKLIYEDNKKENLKTQINMIEELFIIL